LIPGITSGGNGGRKKAKASGTEGSRFHLKSSVKTVPPSCPFFKFLWFWGPMVLKVRCDLHSFSFFSEGSCSCFL
jgi:hypothetical protein